MQHSSDAEGGCSADLQKNRVQRPQPTLPRADTGRTASCRLRSTTLTSTPWFGTGIRQAIGQSLPDHLYKYGLCERCAQTDTGLIRKSFNTSTSTCRLQTGRTLRTDNEEHVHIRKQAHEQRPTYLRETCRILPSEQFGGRASSADTRVPQRTNRAC